MCQLFPLYLALKAMSILPGHKCLRQEHVAERWEQWEHLYPYCMWIKEKKPPPSVTQNSTQFFDQPRYDIFDINNES